MRAFCKNQKIPEANEIESYLLEHGVNATVEDVLPPDRGGWESLVIRYKPKKAPIIVEATRDKTDVLQEIGEFVEYVEELDASEATAKVLAHLRATKIIVACQIPTADIDDDGWRANDELLSCLVEKAGALVQADGEGFYEHEDLILELE